MNCRDFNRPMRQWAADNYFCEACRLEWLDDRWQRRPPPYLFGMEISVTTPDGEWIADAVNWRKA